MKFLIQTRKVNNQRGVNIINSAGDGKDWSNYAHDYADIESAKRESERGYLESTNQGNGECIRRKALR